MRTDTEREIAALLSRTGTAHGAYEESVLGGIYDQNWADWYAAYLLEHGLPRFLGSGEQPTVDLLSRFLTASDEAYRREQPPTDWPTFYARRIVSQLT
jgi:hypothetical protein